MFGAGRLTGLPVSSLLMPPRLLAIWLALFGSVLGEEAIQPRETVALFNGRNLDGFYTWLVDSGQEDPRGVFTVTNGLLRISGEGLGYLATSNSFRNYRLVAEFKWGARNWEWGARVGKARDSGLFLHARGPDGNSHDGNGAFMAAIECNLFQGATGDFLLIRGNAADGGLIAPRIEAPVRPGRDADGWFTYDPEGEFRTVERWGRVNWIRKSPNWEDKIDFRGPEDAENAPGEWNRVECVSRGDTIEIYVNRQLVNAARNVWPNSGKILLQCEGSEIFFRTVRLEPIAGE